MGSTEVLSEDLNDGQDCGGVLRHDEILANWERAWRNEPLLDIDPLASMKIVGRELPAVVVGVALVGDRALCLLFSDGTAGDVDFSGER